MKRIIKKILLYSALLTMFFGGFYSTVSAFVDNCTASVPTPETGYRWALSASAVNYPVADQDGSCTWTGPAVCNSSTIGVNGTYESYSTGPGSEYMSQQYQCLDMLIGINQARINVISNSCTSAGLSWSISPAGLSGSGTSGTYTVPAFMSAGPTLYTIAPSVTSGSYSVTSSDGTGNTLLIDEGNNKTYTVQCTPPVAPTVTVSALPNPVSTGNPTTLSWSSTDATSCSAPWTGSSALSGTQSVTPASSATYSITCTGPGGSATGNVLVTVAIPSSPPVVALSATPTSGTVYAVNPTLTWTTTNSPTSCTASGDWSGSKTNTGGSESIGVLTSVRTYTYTLICTNAAGSGSASATVVSSAATLRPKITLTASPTSGTVNVVSPTITWVTEYAPSSCTASGDWSGSKTATGGSENMGVLTTVRNYTYTLTCLNTMGIQTRSTVVSVVAPIPVPDVSITASPNYINLGSSSTLTWSSTNGATSCTASGAWSGVKASSGSEVVTPIVDSTYILTCTNSTGTSAPNSKFITVNTLATISITSNLSSATWEADSQTGTGSGSVMVTPGASGTAYNFLPEVVSGYTSSVSPVNPVFLIPGDVASLSVTYSAIPPTFDYTLSSTPVSVSQGGGSQSTLITETLMAGVSQNIYLSIYALPPGVSATYAPQPCLPNCTTNVGITASGSAIPGTYTITVIGDTASTGYQRTTNFALTITPAASFTVSCSASPSSIVISQPVTWTANVTGNLGALSYEWIGDEMPVAPGASTNPYTISYTGAGPKTASVVVTDDAGPSSATCPPVTIQLKVKPSFQEI